MAGLKDKDIREPLFEFLEDTFGKVRIIEEKTMGKSRADLVMVIPGSLVGIEIKSDRDTYVRLERQIKDYDKFFDQNYVAVGTSHALHIREHVPDYWGIITVEEVDGELDFYILRKASINPKRKMDSKIKILWRMELAHLLQINGLPVYKAKSKQFVRDKLVEKVPEQDLNDQISEELFERDYNTVAEVIEEYRAANRPVKPKRKRRVRKRPTR